MKSSSNCDKSASLSKRCARLTHTHTLTDGFGKGKRGEVRRKERKNVVCCKEQNDADDDDDDDNENEMRILCQACQTSRMA